MKVHIFAILTLIVNAWFAPKEDIDRMPVNIIYKKNIPPDSLKNFIKGYLEAQKIAIISMEELMALYKDEIMSNTMKMIDAGKLNEKGAQDLGNINVANSLIITFFTDSTEKFFYKIDSMSWSVKLWPKDNTKEKVYKFIPSDSEKRDPYIVLKYFLNNIIESKKLY